MIQHGDVDGLDRPVFYRDSEFKILTVVARFGLRRLSTVLETISVAANTLAPYSPTLARVLGRPSLRTSLRQVGENCSLTVSLQLPELNVHDIQVDLEKSSIVIIWRTLEPSPSNDWWSKLVIQLPFEPKDLKMTVDDANLLSVIVATNTYIFKPNKGLHKHLSSHDLSWRC